VVLLFTIDAGGGHRAAARALVAAAEERKAPFELRVESFQQLLLPLDLLKRTTGFSLEAAYNAILRRRLSLLMVPLLRLMHGAIRVRHGVLVRTLVAWLEKQPRPEAVVSVFPNFRSRKPGAAVSGAFCLMMSAWIVTPRWLAWPVRSAATW